MALHPLEWLFGIPWVFQRLRQRALGGVDFRPAYDQLAVGGEDVVLDIGCGMGSAMGFLTAFKAYHGFDTDPRAIAAFRRRSLPGNVTLYNRPCRPADVMALAPTKVLMIGLLHHVDDPEILPLLRALAALPGLTGIATVDTVLLPGRRINNLLARLDRGRFVRSIAQYDALVERAGLTVAKSFWIESGNHSASYYGMLILKP